MSSVNQYIGRTVDVSAFQGSQPRGEVQLTQALALPGESGQLISGIVKLGQRFLIELLTMKGSLRHRPERGSTFMIEVYGQRIRTVTDLYAAFARGLVDVQRNLTAEDRESDPLDEQYAGATITRAEFQGGQAKVFVAVRSRDAHAVAIMPITVSLT